MGKEVEWNDQYTLLKLSRGWHMGVFRPKIWTEGYRRVTLERSRNCKVILVQIEIRRTEVKFA